MHAAGMTTRLYLSKKVLLLMLSLIFQKHVLYVFFIEMFFIPSPNLGSSKLAQHEMQDIHIKAARASVNQSSIVASMSLNDDVETQKLKATFFHVLSIVMVGAHLGAVILCPGNGLSIVLCFRTANTLKFIAAAPKPLTF